MLPFAPAVLAASIAGLVVTGERIPVAGADVALSGSNTVLHRVTDGHGAFVFSGLNAGTYELAVTAAQGLARVRLDLPSAGASVTLRLLKTVVNATATTLPPVRGSGTDLTLNEAAIARSPAGERFPSLLLQVPGAARGANGVVHVNGDHGDINYIVDGVPVPQELNRSIGSEFDVNDASFVEVLEGAYPAQYGNRFAAVVNVNTRAGNGAPGFDGYVRSGSYAAVDTSLGYHGALASGAFVATLRAQRSDRFLDPPNSDSPHNDGANTNEFFRYTRASGSGYWNLTFSHAYQMFQIPNDVAGGQPASADDNESQNDYFTALDYHRPLMGGGALVLAAGYKNSTIRDFPDQATDFTYGTALNANNGGGPSDCANGIVTACAFSLYSNRTARDAVMTFDDSVVSNVHEVRFGAQYDVTSVLKVYDVTLQPNSFLGQQATTVADDAPNAGNDAVAYLQDSWRIGSRYALDYGLRFDRFRIASDEFARTFSQTSPRIKLTRFIGARAAVYAYYGRFFTPFSLENVSPSAAYRLNEPLLNSIAPFDLKPQRDSDYEVGGHLPVGRGQLGVRVAQKNATDLIDDTQVGVTALHQDINYAQGRISTQSAYYQQPLQPGGRFYASLTRTRSVNKGCETQLLAPCSGAPDDWTPADHDQTWDASSGVESNDRRGGWMSIDGEYGSGLSSANCAPQILFCKVPPHLTFDVEKGIALRPGLVLTVAMLNVCNDRYRVTYRNAQGNHYAPPRELQVGIAFH